MKDIGLLQVKVLKAVDLLAADFSGIERLHSALIVFNGSCFEMILSKKSMCFSKQKHAPSNHALSNRAWKTTTWANDFSLNARFSQNYFSSGGFTWTSVPVHVVFRAISGFLVS